MNLLIALICMVTFANVAQSQISYPDNETGIFEDLLTPEYYLSPPGHAFRHEVNTFIHFARHLQFQHPLYDSNGVGPQYSVPENGEFGAGKGPTGTSQHHAAVDFHIENNATEVNLYAAHDGIVSSSRNNPKYRHFLSITCDVEDSTGILLGKLVTIYGHIDLDLDTAANIYHDGELVTQGSLISAHLYTGTVGGPHLHFETRYYRPGDTGLESFYGFVGPEGSTVFTEPSTGSWSYGFWNPDTGYGFANHENHLPANPTGLTDSEADIPEGYLLFSNYPNPFNPSTTLKFWLPVGEQVSLIIYDLRGRVVKTFRTDPQTQGWHTELWTGLDDSVQPVPTGIYLAKLYYRSTYKVIKLLYLN